MRSTAHSAETSIEAREGLPEALRALVAEWPRASWSQHKEFGPLAQFWLSRHMGFRQLLDRILTDTQLRIEQKLDEREYAQGLAQFGSQFLHGLQEHHGVEDHYYFPKMAELAPSLEAGFELLDGD